METREAIEMMQRCRDEIQSMQERIKYLAPRAEAYEVLRNVVMMQNRGGEGMPMGQDVVYLLDSAITRELDRAKQAEPPDRSKEYRGGVVSAEEGQMRSTISGVEQYRAAKEGEANALKEQHTGRSLDVVMSDLEAQQAKRNVGKRPGYDGVKD